MVPDDPQQLSLVLAAQVVFKKAHQVLHHVDVLVGLPISETRQALKCPSFWSVGMGLISSMHIFVRGSSIAPSALM
jgi:hypothetical protein